MSLLLSIPNEVQTDILSYLPKKDLSVVGRTCQHLHDVSIRILYRKVELNSWSRVHSFFIPPLGNSVREGRRIELEMIRELYIQPNQYTLDHPLHPIPIHLKTTPLSVPLLRVEGYQLALAAPLLAFLESPDFQTRKIYNPVWSHHVSPRSFALETLRNALRSAVGPIQAFCVLKVVDFIMEAEPDEIACAIFVDSRRLELTKAAVERLHRWIAEAGLATIHSLPNELLAQILSYLPKPTLVSCLTVSQRIHDVAIPFLYSKVLITRWSKLKSFFLPGTLILVGSEVAVRHAERRRKEWDSIRELSIRFEKAPGSKRTFWGRREEEYDVPRYGFFGPVPLSLKTRPLVLRNLVVEYPSFKRWSFSSDVECDPSPLLSLLSYMKAETFFLAARNDHRGGPPQKINKSVARLVEETARASLKWNLAQYHPFCSSSIMDSFLKFDPEELLLCRTSDEFRAKLVEASEILHRNIAEAGYASFSDLPSNLTTRILSFLPLSTLTATARISRTFHSATLPVLYKVVTLRSWRQVESFLFDPSLDPSINPEDVAARTENRRSELRLVRQLVLDFRSGYEDEGSSLDLASRLSPSAHLSAHPLLLYRLTIIHLDLIDPLLPILPWFDPSSLALQSLGGGFSSNDNDEEEEGDPTWRTLLSLRAWTRIDHVDLGVQHGHHVASLPEGLLASSPFRSATSGVLALIGGTGGKVASYRPTLVSLFDSLCPSMRSVKVVCTGAKGVRKGIRKMLDDGGWGRKWEELEVEVRVGLKAGKATK